MARPILIAALAVVWLAGGLVALVPDQRAAMAKPLLPWVSTSVAMAAVWTGATLDVLVGLGLVFGRWRRLALGVGTLLALGYLGGLTVLAPGLWLDPWGALVKTFAILAAMAALWACASDRG